VVVILGLQVPVSQLLRVSTIGSNNTGKIVVDNILLKASEHQYGQECLLAWFFQQLIIPDMTVWLISLWPRGVRKT
jgi:hypothetical protein